MKSMRVMSSFGRQVTATVAVALTTFGFGELANAATPEQVLRGQQLFTQEFTTAPLTENGDGLGPLFNHTSCAACHHAGGIGGAGDHRFNARTFAISSMQFRQARTQASLIETLRSTAPGFVGKDGTTSNTFPMHRHGGSPAFDVVRQKAMATFNPHWSDDSKIRSDDIHVEASAVHVTDPNGAIAITGHVFSRNTTALFGAGVIDLVPDSVLMQQVKAQQRHAEIHGRPATLSDGRLGKFGWRANFASLLEFTENACVNELGLQSKRVGQPQDMMNPSYENTHADIDDPSIVAMTSFIAALPTPTRLSPNDSMHRNEIATGEQRFNAVGCSVCHVSTLGPATGIYSDLLLHDMGYASRDYSTALPYIKHIDLENSFVKSESTTTTTTTTTRTTTTPPRPRTTYSGGTSSLTGGTSSMTTSTSQPNAPFRPRNSRSREFRFESPTRPPRITAVPVNGLVHAVTEEKREETGTRATTIVKKDFFQPTLRIESIPTNFTQEWRTAPLWGLRDSAPYMHDGRAETILEAIAMHGGESEKTRNRFFALSYEDQQAVLAFLDTFVAPQSGVIPAPKDFTRRQLAKN